MSTFLYKVGKSTYNKPWQFIISWIAIFGVVLVLLITNGMHLDYTMKIEGTESQKVLDQLAEELPEAAGGAAQIVFTAPKGERLDTPERSTLINKAIHEVYNLEYVINPANLTGEAGTSDTSNNQRDEAKAATTPEKLMFVWLQK